MKIYIDGTETEVLNSDKNIVDTAARRTKIDPFSKIRNRKEDLDNAKQVLEDFKRNFKLQKQNGEITAEKYEELVKEANEFYKKKVESIKKKYKIIGDSESDWETRMEQIKINDMLQQMVNAETLEERQMLLEKFQHYFDGTKLRYPNIRDEMSLHYKEPEYSTSTSYYQDIAAVEKEEEEAHEFY